MSAELGRMPDPTPLGAIRALQTGIEKDANFYLRRGEPGDYKVAAYAMSVYQGLDTVLKMLGETHT